MIGFALRREPLVEGSLLALLQLLDAGNPSLLAVLRARRGEVTLLAPTGRTHRVEGHSLDHVLLLSMHHIICDEWSMGVFLRELASLYEAYSRGQSSPLLEPPLPYADFAQRQQAWLKGEAAAGQLSYWKQQLAGSPAALDLPTDHQHLPVPTLRGSMYRWILPGALSETLKALSQREGVSLDMILVAALLTLLHRRGRNG